MSLLLFVGLIYAHGVDPDRLAVAVALQVLKNDMEVRCHLERFAVEQNFSLVLVFAPNIRETVVSWQIVHACGS